MAESVQQPSLALVRHADAIESSDNTCRPQAKAARLMLAEILRKEKVVARDARTVSKMRFHGTLHGGMCVVFLTRVCSGRRWGFRAPRLFTRSRRAWRVQTGVGDPGLVFPQFDVMLCASIF